MTEEIKEFGGSGESIPFKIRGSLYHAVPEIPAETALVALKGQAAAIQSADTENAGKEGLEVMKDFFALVLVDEEEHADLVSRLSDKKNPIGMKTLQEVLEWLMEQYGLRPTQ